MQNYKEQFKGKKITIMGLGILGRGLGYTKFLAECGADLIVTDLKTEKELATSIKALSKYKSIRFVLGKHRLEDFRNRDLIIKAAGVPADSVYIQEAKKYDTQIEMDVSLFAKCAPEVEIIAVTGTRGKTMTTTLIYEILSAFAKASAGQGKSINKFWANKPKVFLGGNIRGIATLPLLKKVHAGDILVCELDSWQLQGFGPTSHGLRGASEAGISPHISVFTSFMPDHMNYYGSAGSPQVGSTSLTTSKKAMKSYFSDKANIFKYQKREDILIIRPGVKKLIPKNIKSKLITVSKKSVANWKFIVPGEHQRENLACAIKVAELFKIPIAKIKKAVAEFKGVEGRLQLLRTYKGIKIYNDNNATTPEATIAGLRAVGDAKKRRVVLIVGGDDKKLDTKDLVKEIPKWCSKVVLFKERGTDLIRDEVFKFAKKGIEVYEEEGLENTVKRAISVAKKGETVLYSPGFSSFGKYFKNEYERNDMFVKIIKKLK